MPNNVLMSRRVFRLRSAVQVDVQFLRLRIMKQLEQLYGTASAIARGQIQWQRVEGKKRLITFGQRRMWFRAAVSIVQVMGDIAHGFDEKLIDKDLAELQKLVDGVNAESRDLPAEGTGWEPPLK